jgi:hypothetical protein
LLESNGVLHPRGSEYQTQYGLRLLCGHRSGPDRW